MKPKLIITLTITLCLTGCYYDSEEYLFPDINTTCNTDSITYSGTIQPVLEQYCYLCHSNANAPSFGSNIKLEDYSDVLLRVNDLSLYGAIAHQSEYSPMPKGGGKLDDCIIEQVRIWIEAGAPDN